MAKMDFLMLAGILFLILGLSPVSASLNKISPGNEVFIGESGLDLSEFINNPVMIGWYDPNQEHLIDEIPADIEKIADPSNFYVDPEIFIGKMGNWYLWDGETHGDLVFILEDPSLSLKIWDGTKHKDVTDKTISQGNFINFIIETNMESIAERAGFASDDGPFSINIIQGKNGNIISELPGKENTMISLSQLPVYINKWFWVGMNDDHSKAAKEDGWNTDDPKVIPGEYLVWASCNLNGMMDNYLLYDGSQYTGKTVSSVKKIEIIDKVEPEPTTPEKANINEKISASNYQGREIPAGTTTN